MYVHYSHTNYILYILAFRALDMFNIQSNIEHLKLDIINVYTLYYSIITQNIKITI